MNILISLVNLSNYTAKCINFNISLDVTFGIEACANDFDL